MAKSVTTGTRPTRFSDAVWRFFFGSRLRIALTVYGSLFLAVIGSALVARSTASPAPLGHSTHALQHELSQSGITYVDPCMVLSPAQAEAITGATLHTSTNKIASYKLQDPSCYYSTAPMGALGEGTFTPGATAFQIDTFRESPASLAGFDGRQASAKLSSEESYVPINVAAQPELKGATAAFYEFGYSTNVASGITFTTKGVTVSIWEQPATQQDLLNIARVAIMNLS